MSSLYEISSLFVLMRNKPNILSQILGILVRGTQVNVISISGNWAYFLYNNKNAYVLKSCLSAVDTHSKSSGSILLKYLNYETNEEVYASQTLSNLLLGSYSYNAKDIYGYKLVTASPQSVTLATENPNQTIIFYYQKILCSVTIHYIDETTQNYISDSQIINNLSLGTYTYSSIDIYGYNLNDEESKKVTLTEDNPNIEISFKYDKLYGTVTLQYIAGSSNAKLSADEVYSNLEFGHYSYTAKSISGYKLSSNQTEAVTINDNNLNVIVIFSYTKILGSITIKYLDKVSLTELSGETILSNLELGSYNFDAIHINGYSAYGDSSKTIVLTDDNPDVEIDFMYSEILGSITVNYLDENNNKVAHSNIDDNLKLGDYTYSAISISGYKITSENSMIITLTEDDKDKTINFIYNKILGKITIKYLIKDNAAILHDAVVYSDLSLGVYSYDALTFAGYTSLESSQTVTLTEENLDIVVNFEYEKAEIDIPTDLNINEVPYISTYYIKPIVKPGEEVFIDYYITDYYQKEYLEENYSEIFTVTVRVEGQPDRLYTGLNSGDHQVSLGSFSTEGEQKFSIVCTDKYDRNSHELFNFFLVQGDIEVKEYVMTEDDLAIYNIKNTDDYEEKVYVKVDKLTDTTTGTKIEEVANATVVPSHKYICFIGTTEEDEDGNPIMQTTAARFWLNTIVKYADDYDKDAVLAESTNTRIGLQKLLDDKKAEGYNKLKLLPGIYRVDHCSRINSSTSKLTNEEIISIPSNFTLDMNGCTLKQNQFTGSTTEMIILDNTYDSHVINGTIDGDYYTHDYSNSPDNSEWVNGIRITCSSRYSSYENIFIKNITGYGASSGGASSIDGKYPFYYIYPGWKDLSQSYVSGDIDRTTGNIVECKNRIVSDFIDIGDFSKLDYICISPFLGYGGITADIWNYICHFYDMNKKYIKSIDGLQHRLIRVPVNTKYIRITSLGLFPNWQTVNLSRFPMYCAFKNIKLENCRCVGLAQSQMNNMLIENCEFTLCGQSAAKCAYDAEDGWESMQDVTLKNNNFHDNYVNDFLTCAGQNFIIDGMQNGKVHFWGRSNSYVIKNCSNLTGATIECGGENISSAFGRSYIRIYNNTINDGIIQLTTSKNGYLFNTLIKDCNINTRPCGSTSRNIYLRCTIDENKLNNNDSYLKALYNSIGSGYFKNCIIINKNGNKGTSNSIFDNCSISNSKILALGNIKFNKCITENLIIEEASSDYTINLSDCNLTNSNFFINYWQLISTTTIQNCIINNKDYLIKTPHYSLKRIFCIKNSKIICNSSNGIIWLYDDRVNSKDTSNLSVPENAITLDSNYIELQYSSFIIGGINNSSTNKINILFKNNILQPSTLLLCNTTTNQNENITISTT